MWRKGSMFLFNTSFARQPKITRLNNPKTISHQAQVGRIRRALNYNSSSYCYYYSVVSPRHEWEPGWFMRNIQRRFMWNESSEKKYKEAAVDALKLRGRCFDTMVGNSEEYRKILLSREYFAETIADPPQDMSGEVIDLYVMWAIGRDDFKIDHDLLRQIICVYKKKKRNMLLRDTWEKVMYSIWDMMLARSAAFKEEGVVTLELLIILLTNFPTSGLLPRQHINMLQVFGCVPTLYSYSGNAANTCVNLSDDDPCFARVRQNILDIVGSRPTFNPGHVGWSLMFFCDADLLELAHHVYVAAKDKLNPPLPLPEEVFYLVRLLSYKDDEASLRLAVDMLADDAARTGGKGSGAAFTSVVAGLCRVNDLRGAKKLIHDMILKGPPPGIRAFSALIKSLCLSGDLEGAFHMLQLAESRGLKPYLGLYRLLIKAYKKRGMVDQASKLLSMAAHKHPNSTLKV